MTAPGRLAKRLITPPLVLLAALVLLFEELAWNELQALAARLSRWAPLARLEAWIAGLGPWPTLLLFAVPATGLFPVKLLAVWLIGTGHPLGGLAVLLAAKVVGTAIAARLFAIGRDKLMTIRWFAAGYRLVMALHDRVHRALRALPGWEAAARAVHGMARRVRSLASGDGWLARRFAAARHRLTTRRARN